MNQAPSRSKSGWAIGIDIGGTKIAAAPVTFPNGTVGNVHEIATRPERGSDFVLRDLEAVTAKVIEAVGEVPGKFFGVGLGVCELVDPQGELLSANCIDWSAKQVRQALGRFGPVRIEADVRAAALAESKFGAGANANSFLYVTVGTGISCCMVIGGKVFSGARGAAGTMASGPFPDLDGRVMPSLEAVASGPGLLASYQARGGKAASTQTVFERAEAGEERAVTVVRRGARALGATFGWLINLLDPELVILGGGLGLRKGLYRKEIKQAAREHVWWEGHRKIEIISAALGANAGVIGAAAVLWAEWQSESRS